MVRWIFPAFAAVLLMPLSAWATESCRHEQNRGIPAAAREEPLAASVERVPAMGSAASCADHSSGTRAIKAGGMFACKMKEGCCIKADGPLSTGLNNRAPTNDDHALGISLDQPQTGGRLVGAAPPRLYPQRNPPEPDPRPPLA